MMHQFVVVSVSDRPNSFGLWGHLMCTASGYSYEFAAGNLYKCKVGDVLDVTLVTGQLAVIEHPTIGTIQHELFRDQPDWGVYIYPTDKGNVLRRKQASKMGRENIVKAALNKTT